MSSNSRAIVARVRGAREVRGRLFDAIAETERQIARLHARQARLVDAVRIAGEAEVRPAASGLAGWSGPKGWDATIVARRELTSELACTLRMPERAAESLVARSRALVHQLPGTLAALKAGRISVRHAHTVIEHAWSVPPEAMIEFETLVLPAAETLTVAKLDRRARVLRERMHPESLTVRAVAAREDRDVRFEPGRDGMGWLNAWLPAETAVAAFNRITQIAASLRSPDDSRTLAQLRADVFGDLLIDGVTDIPEHSILSPEQRQDLEGLRTMVADIEELTGRKLSIQELAEMTAGDRDPDQLTHRRTTPLGTGRGIRAEVMVTVPALTLLVRSNEPAILDGYGPIDPQTAARLAAGAPSFHRIPTHPESGAVLSVGRDSYAVPKDLRRWLRVRDGTCRHPGCGRRAKGCEIDHTIDWQYDGMTEQCNLAHLCPAHHHLKHHTRWSVTQRSDGTLDWVTPTGHRYLTEPEVTMAGAAVRSPTFR